MTIALAKDVEDFLQEQVRAGVCADPSELVNDVLRSLREQRIQPSEVTPELEEWLLASADKPATPLTGDDFAGIRQRARARTLSCAARCTDSVTCRAGSSNRPTTAKPAPDHGIQRRR